MHEVNSYPEEQFLIHGTQMTEEVPRRAVKDYMLILKNLYPLMDKPRAERQVFSYT